MLSNCEKESTGNSLHAFSMRKHANVLLLCALDNSKCETEILFLPFRNRWNAAVNREMMLFGA